MHYGYSITDIYHYESHLVLYSFLVTEHGGLYSCEMLRIPQCLDNRLRDDGKVVSPTHKPRSTPQKHFSASGTHFC
jgi:hypothetical protein